MRRRAPCLERAWERSIASYALGDFAGAEQAALAMMESARTGAVMKPEDPDRQFGLSSALFSLGVTRLGAGKLEEAAESFRAAAGLRAELARRFPNVIDYQRNLMVAYGTLSDVLGGRTGENLGDTDGALAACSKAVAIARHLLAQDQLDRRARSDVSAALLRLGSVQVETGRYTEGLRGLQEAFDLNAGLLKDDPQNYRYRYIAMFLHRKFGETQAQIGHRQEAVRQFETAVAMAADLMKGPDANRAQLQKVMSNIRLAMLYGMAHDPRAKSLADGTARELNDPGPWSPCPGTELRCTATWAGFNANSAEPRRRSCGSKKARKCGGNSSTQSDGGTA